MDLYALRYKYECFKHTFVALDFYDYAYTIKQKVLEYNEQINQPR